MPAMTARRELLWSLKAARLLRLLGKRRRKQRVLKPFKSAMFKSQVIAVCVNGKRLSCLIALPCLI